MSDEYIKYWGLTQQPFLLAPDGKMMCITGQYFECFERLKYAINTNKGGALIASEDPGLGKTTTLLKLVEEMEEQYGKNFRYALIDHPTLTAAQMIEQITGALTGEKPSDDKLKNLNLLKESLLETKREGGKNVIIIDEGQMLCEAKDVLQELRILINLTHNNEYLHTFIFSGQKALWDTLQGIPEFWQRLPVRYYFTPLRFEESRELIRYRLNKAGLDVAREIFTDEALEMIHKYSQGLPRTIISIADMALLNGFMDRARRVGSKEVIKAITAMTGKSDSTPYVSGAWREDQTESAKTPAESPQSSPVFKTPEWISQGLTQTSSKPYLKTFFAVIAILFFVFIGVMAQRFFSSAKPAAPNASVAAAKEQAAPAKVEQPSATPPGPAEAEEPSTEATGNGGAKPDSTVEAANEDEKIGKDLIAAFKEEKKRKPKLSVTVNKDLVNVRRAPYLDSPRILTIVQGEILNVLDKRKDEQGITWYKVSLYNERTGWVSEKVVSVTPTPEQ